MNEENVAEMLMNPNFASLVAEKLLSAAPSEGHTEEEKWSLEDKGFYFLFDEIYSESVLGVIQWILENNFRKIKRPEFLTLCINSPGGDMTSAFALATPAAIVPTPTSETSFTLIRASLLAFFKSYINCDKSSIE